MITAECTHPPFIVYVEGALTEAEHARLKAALDAFDTSDRSPGIMPDTWRYTVVECSWCRRRVDTRPLLEFPGPPPAAVKA